MDKRWRRRVANEFQSISGDGGRILDVACGTGDLALALLEATGTQVIGTDFCRPMLELASRKASKLEHSLPLVEGDALHLPFPDNLFAGVTVAFGLRNFSSVEGGLKELFRVLKPAGMMGVLEFSKPTVPGFRALFRLYFTKVLPLLGGIVSGSKGAYEYLPDSVSRFPDQEQLAALMRSLGFEDVHYLNLTGGIAALHLARKPRELS